MSGKRCRCTGCEVSDRFLDRADAGRRLAAAVALLASTDPVVLGLPRGGVPVAFEVAEALGAPLDVLVVRKLGAPRQPELAIGALAEGGETLVDTSCARRVGADEAAVDAAMARETHQIQRGVALFRGGRPLRDLAGRDVIVVDDGLATGLTAEVALRVIRRRAPRTLTLAVPVGAADSVARLRLVADEMVCLLVPDHFLAVGTWYRRFGQTSDEEVISLLSQNRSRREGHEPPTPG